MLFYFTLFTLIVSFSSVVGLLTKSFRPCTVETSFASRLFSVTTRLSNDPRGRNSKNDNKFTEFILEKIGNMTRRGNDYGSINPKRQERLVKSPKEGRNQKKLQSWGRRPGKSEWNPLQDSQQMTEKETSMGLRTIEELLKVDDISTLTVEEMQFVITCLENLFEETTGLCPSDHDIDEILISLISFFLPNEDDDTEMTDNFFKNYQDEEMKMDYDFDEVPELHHIMKDYWSKQQLSKIGRNFLNESFLPDHLNVPIKHEIDLSSTSELRSNHLASRRRAYKEAMSRSSQNSNVRRFSMPKDRNLKSKNFEVITDSNFTFADVGGMSEIKSQMLQCADMIKSYEKYEKFNVRIPRGMLLTGPPGNGKTMLVKAFCGAIDARFIITSGAEFQEKYVGVGPSKVRELFQLARDAEKPCVIFIDEIDGVGRKRHSDGESSSAERDSTLNELLVQLDGFKENTGIFVVAATNAEYLLDPALVRPGRFDRKIVVPNPDEITRREIINIHAEGKPRATDVHCDLIVAETSGMSGAEVENVLNEAMLSALQKNRYVFSKDDLNFAVTKQTVGYMSSTRKLDRANLFKIAIHEMGHAVVGYLMPNFYNLVSVRINVNSPNTPGSTHFELLESTGGLKSKEFMKEEIMVCLAGQCAETIFFGENNVLSGSSSDIEKARDLVFHMLTSFGMSDSGKLHYGRSESSLETMDNEIDFVLKELRDRTTEIIKKNRATIENLAQKLTSKGHLERKDIEPTILRHLP